MISRQTSLDCWAETSKFERHIQLVSEQLKIACCQFYCLLLVCLGDFFPFQYFEYFHFHDKILSYVLPFIVFYPMASFSCAYGALVSV